MPQGPLPSCLQPPGFLRHMQILSSGRPLPFLFPAAASPAVVHRVQMEFCDYWPPLAGNGALSVVQENLPRAQPHTWPMQTPESQRLLGFTHLEVNLTHCQTLKQPCGQLVPAHHGNLNPETMSCVLFMKKKILMIM